MTLAIRLCQSVAALFTSWLDLLSAVLRLEVQVILRAVHRSRLAQHRDSRQGLGQDPTTLVAPGTVSLHRASRQPGYMTSGAL